MDHRLSWASAALVAFGLSACGPGGAGGDDFPPGAPDAGTPPGRQPDAHPPAGADAAPPDAGASIRDRCFPGLGDPAKGLPDYDQFGVVVGAHCDGTNHQDITGVDKVVFLGDSITEGTPPSTPAQYYRNLLTERLRGKFGADLEMAECSNWGARTDDLLMPPHDQVRACFPGVEPRRTLVVMTMGGNDMHAILKDALAGDTLDQSMAKVDQAVALLRATLDWFRADPARFPAGVFVVFANVYEFTDAVGDFPQSCPAAVLDGITRGWPEGRPVFIHLNEELVRAAVDTGTDAMFLSERFCGHGFHSDDADNECYRGPGTERWFDLTCIHPNPAGHQAIADAFFHVIDE
jgi:lysophospholipase L1-like esterase